MSTAGKQSLRKFLGLVVFSSLLALIILVHPSDSKRVGEINVEAYREKIKRMFYHAYDGYLTHAYPYDELQPLTCSGHDTWGSYSLTLIDALDTLAVMGNFSEFRRISDILISKGEGFFDMDINVSVFETNIRIVGGLLSAHQMMKRAGMVVEPAWPCSGPLLRMADSIARKILPAFDTPTGMPYGTVNLRHGVPKGETTITCTAGVGTFLVEFGTLSRLTGDPIFEKTAMRAIRSVWKYRSPIGLLGNHIDVSSGRWTAMDSGIGGGIDSYFEYLVKGAVLFNMPELIHMFREYESAINKFLKRDDWYMWAQMNKGGITMPMFTSLDGYWPSIKGMLGDLDEAMKTIHNFHQVWRQFGFTPEYYNIPKAEVHQGREGYPLRPEIVESVMYLYRATKDPYLLEIGVDVIEAIEHSARTSCGYATVKDVRDHRLEDRMESFFLAETTKYLYLLFDPDNFIHNNGSHGDVVNTPSGQCVIEAGGYVFNTEAHPIDLAAVHCCSAAKKEEDQVLQDFHDNLDLLSLLDLDEEGDSERRAKIKRKKKKIEKMEKQIKTVEEEQSGNFQQQQQLQEQQEQQQESGFSGGNNGKDIHQYLHHRAGNDIDEEDDDDEEYADFDAFDEQERKEKLQNQKSQKEHVSQNERTAEVERNYMNISSFDDLDIDSFVKNITAERARLLEQELKEEQGYKHMEKGIEEEGLQGINNNVRNEEGFREVVQMGAKEVPQNSSGQLDEEKSHNQEVVSSHSDQIADSKVDANSGKVDGKSVEEGHSDLQNSNTFDSESNRIIEQGTREHDGKVDLSMKTVSQDTAAASEEARMGQGQVTSTVDSVKEQVIVVQVSPGASSRETEQGQAKSVTAQEPQNSEKHDTEEEVVTNPAIEKFKSHLEDVIQQQQGNEVLQTAKAAEPTSKSPLENKRQNLLSITTKILNMISGSSSDESQEKETSSRSPSLGGLYASLANYPLKYFHDPATMHCPAQPFHNRISVYGEMFPDQ